jgi:hypothetical protein
MYLPTFSKTSYRHSIGQTCMARWFEVQFKEKQVEEKEVYFL